MIALVTDSTACLTLEEAQMLGIRMVPHSYTADGSTYLEGAAERNGDYVSVLQAAHSLRTVQTSAGAYLSTFEELRRSGYEVLCVVISSRLSGAYSSAHCAAASFADGSVQVVDSLTTAGSLRYLLCYARALCQKGLPLHDVVEALQDARSRLGAVFSVNHMDALRRSGRIGILRQSVGTILNQRPLLCLKDGGVVGCGMSRGRTEQAKKLLEQVPADIRRLTVHYFGRKKDVELLWQLTQERFPDKELLLREGGPVLSLHLGLGTLGIAWEAS